MSKLYERILQEEHEESNKTLTQEGKNEDARSLEPVTPRPMRYVDIPRAVETSVESLQNDPLVDYLVHTPDAVDTRLKRVFQRFSFYAMWIMFISRRATWTIDGGHANVGYTDPTKPRSLFGKLIDCIVGNLLQNTLFQSIEQRKRKTEYRTKLNNKFIEVLGERQKEMLCLNTIATSPARRGRGYATTLCKIVTNLAGADSRSTWLVSSNVKANTGFYNSLGFFTVGEIVLGEDNPTWKEPPVVVAIMTKEAAIKDVS